MTNPFHWLRALLLMAVLTSPAAAQLPQGFSNQLVISGFDSPVAMACPTLDEVLVCEQGGNIHLVDLSTSIPTSELFLTVPNVQEEFERGLIAIALDPNYDSNGWFYVYYFHLPSSRFRVSRFTRFNDQAAPSSEVIVWQDNSPSSSCCHHGGGLDFGPDGCLYLTIGDEFEPLQAADLTESGGKIHRFFPDGSIPQDNPFFDGVGPNVDTIWAFGLRNPFRASWDLLAERFFIAEVGGNNQAIAREDIHLGAVGANFGWPACEGPCDNPDFPTCNCATADNPLFSYDHSIGQAVVGGFVYRGSQFPAEFEGAYFYADYPSQWIRFLTFDPSGTAVSGSTEFEPAAGQVTFLDEAPDGSLIYCDLDGNVRRIRFDSGNLAPQIISVNADIVSGLSPLDVTFNGVADDPEGDPTIRLWDFGDGQTGTGDTVTHTYTHNGVYQARWVVSDFDQSTLSDPIEIRVGAPPVVNILAPIDGSLFRAGDTVSFSAGGSDPDGLLTPSNFTWEVFFLHNDHDHPSFGPFNNSSGSFVIPPSGHDFSDDTGFAIVLTVTDADGLSTQSSVSILPDKANITIDTIPSGLTVLFDGLPRLTPFVSDTLIFFEHTIRALPSACLGDDAFTFESWSDAGEIAHTIVVPDFDMSFVANYDPAGTCSLPVDDGLVTWLKGDFGINEAAGLVSSWADSSPLGNSLVATGNPMVVSGGLNGHDYVSLDGQDDELSRLSDVNGLPVGNADRTMFAVVRYEEVAGGGLGYGNPICNEGFAFSVSGGGNPLLSAFCPGNDFEAQATATDAGWMLLSVVHEAGTFGHYKNGQAIDIRSHDFSTVADRILIGATLDSGFRRPMDVAEFLIYDRALSDVERLEIESYLQSEYFGQACEAGDCNSNGVADDCELLNGQRSINLQYGDWVNIPDQSFRGDFTLEAWVRLPAPITDDDALTARLPNAQEVSFPNGRLRLLAGGDVVIANTPLEPDEWTHVALTRSGSALTVYLNGVLDGTGTWDGIFTPHTIGHGRLGARTVGRFDEFRLWNVARSEVEIQAQMNRVLTGPVPGLVGSWRFDDYLVDQQVLDFSGNGQHGVLGLDGSDEFADPARDQENLPLLVREEDLDMDGLPDQCQLGESVCEASLTSAGCLPEISYSGTPSLSGPDNFVVSGSNLPIGVTGWALVGRALYSSPNPSASSGGAINVVPVRVGFPLCIRLPHAFATGTTQIDLDPCSGNLDLVIAQADLMQNGYQPGETLIVQIVLDDPALPNGQKVHTSALSFTLLP